MTISPQMQKRVTVTALWQFSTSYKHKDSETLGSGAEFHSAEGGRGCSVRWGSNAPTIPFPRRKRQQSWLCWGNPWVITVPLTEVAMALVPTGQHLVTGVFLSASKKKNTWETQTGGGRISFCIQVSIHHGRGGILGVSSWVCGSEPSIISKGPFREACVQQLEPMS